MFRTFGLTGVAISLALVPSLAGAVSLNIGGGGVSLSTGPGGSGSGGVQAKVGGDDLLDVTTGSTGTTNAATANVKLGDDAQRNGAVVDLFGADGAVADVDAGLGARGALLPAVGGDGEDDVTASLFGSGQDVGIDLFGTGSTGGGDDGADGGTGVGSNTGDGADGVQPGATGKAVRVATAGAGGAGGCFSPNDAQIAHLLDRNAYSAQISARLQAVEQVQVVPINLCAGASSRVQAALAADANIGRLQSAIAADADLSAALEPSYQPSDVLAADQSGDDLTVYVY